MAASNWQSGRRRSNQLYMLGGKGVAGFDDYGILPSHGQKSSCKAYTPHSGKVVV